MSKSIFEKACERIQPRLLEKGTKLTKREAESITKYCVDHFSMTYGNGYASAFCEVFNDVKDGKSQVKFCEAVENVKKLKKNCLFTEGYSQALAIFYGRTYEEVERLAKEEKYWMSYGSTE